jgi:hypothetical protein
VTGDVLHSRQGPIEGQVQAPDLLLAASLTWKCREVDGKQQLPISITVRWEPGDEPRDQKEGRVWFALNDDRPLFTFAGIWTEFKGDRGTKSKPILGPPLVHGFASAVAEQNERELPRRQL